MITKVARFEHKDLEIFIFQESRRSLCSNRATFVIKNYHAMRVPEMESLENVDSPGYKNFYSTPFSCKVTAV